MFLCFILFLFNSFCVRIFLSAHIQVRSHTGDGLKNVYRRTVCVVLRHHYGVIKSYIIARGHISVQLFLKLLPFDLHLLLRSSLNERWKILTVAGGYSVSCISCLFAVLVSFTALYQQPSSKSWQNLRKKFPPLLRRAQWHHMCFCRRDTLNDTPWHGISAFAADAVYHLNTGRVSCKALPRPLFSSPLHSSPPLFSFSFLFLFSLCSSQECSS